MLYKYQGDLPEFLRNKPLHTGDGFSGRFAIISTLAEDKKYIGLKTAQYMKINESLEIAKVQDQLNLSAIIRENKCGGIPCTLGDGQTYLIPVLRAINGGTVLPQRAMLVEGGIQYEIMPEYLEVAALADTIWDWVTTKQLPSDEEVIASVAKLLAVNYHITYYDVLSFGLVSTNTLMKIFEIAIDLKAYVDVFTDQNTEEIIKKKLEA